MVTDTLRGALPARGRRRAQGTMNNAQLRHNHLQYYDDDLLGLTRRPPVFPGTDAVHTTPDPHPASPIRRSSNSAITVVSRTHIRR